MGMRSEKEFLDISDSVGKDKTKPASIGCWMEGRESHAGSWGHERAPRLGWGSQEMNKGNWSSGMWAQDQESEVKDGTKRPVCRASKVGCELEVAYSGGKWHRLDMGYRVDVEAQAGRK